MPFTHRAIYSVASCGANPRLVQGDNNAHTTKEYAEAMLHGMNNASDGSTAQQTLLSTEYNSLLTKYGLTANDLNAFYIKNLNATSGKLPTSGCN